MSDEISYSVEIKGMKGLMAKLDAATRAEVILRSLHQSGIFIASWAVSNKMSGRPGLQVQTGRLTSSLLNNTANSPARKEGNTYLQNIGTNVIYARIHEYGGTIFPGAKGFLAWKDRNTNKWIFTKRPVVIPARPYLRPAIEDESNQQSVLSNLLENIQKAMENAS